jgi:hypothetical protein
MAQSTQRHRTIRSRVGVALACLIAVTTSFSVPATAMAVAGPAVTGVAVDCAAMTAPVYMRINPSTTASLLTRSLNEARRSVDYGFTNDYGTAFRAATAGGTDLVGAHRMFLPGRDTFVWMTSPSEIELAKSIGYVDEGINFYASTAPAPCLIPVIRYYKNGIHRFVANVAQGAAERAAGWFAEGVAFYAAPPAPVAGTDTTFSIVVYPDTQEEVFSDADTRIANRTQWVLDNRSTLDTRFVIHTGDLVNWDTPGHEQYVRASAGLQGLDAAGLPYAIAVGNHDTGAVCAGGGACPGQPASVNLRDTSTINQFFPVSRFPRMAGQFEPGKIDNAYSTFTAGGRHWLVLTLELWPRTASVEWARTIVARFSDHNVIVATHSYLEGNGSIVQNNGGYGANSPQYVYDRLIRPYPNVRMVFSGHVGLGGSRVDTGDNGNTVASFLGCFHSGTTNPLQVIEIDTASNSVSTRYYAPQTGTEYPEFSRTIYGMSWIG